MMHFNHNPMGWWSVGPGLILMVLFWGLIIVGFIVLIKWMISQAKDNDEKENSAVDILEQRYAKGEITEEELKKKKKTIKELS